MPKMRHRAAGIFGYLPPMQGARATTVDRGVVKGSWSEIFRNVIATTGLACLTAVALLPGPAPMTVSPYAMGIGIGVCNVHLFTRRRR